MNDWQSTWLGRRSLPRDLSGFEIEAFFTFSGNERRVIEERRGPALKIALALQIGFLRHCLLVSTDRLLLMVRRRVADLWRIAAVGVDVKLTDWARLYQELLGELARLVSDPGVSSETMREQLLSLIQAHRARRPRSRAEIVRERLIAGVRPVRALLKALARLPWSAAPTHPLLEALGVLRGLYERDQHDLPVSLDLPVGRVWRAALESPDRERAFAALEVATLLNLRRALRNGTVWIEHSLRQPPPRDAVHSRATVATEPPCPLSAALVVGGPEGFPRAADRTCQSTKIIRPRLHHRPPLLSDPARPDGT